MSGRATTGGSSHRSGYLERDDVDGEYGPKTRQAVRRFQRDEGLRVTGEMDDRTVERLRRRAERG
jgi:peptidoglycan hydrolase-like protein with peptidoglycan-binding domain